VERGLGTVWKGVWAQSGKGLEQSRKGSGTVWKVCQGEALPVPIGVDPQLKVLMRGLQEVPNGRPQLGPHLDALQPEQLPLLLGQSQCIIGQVGSEQRLMLRLNLTEAS